MPTANDFKPFSQSYEYENNIGRLSFLGLSLPIFLKRKPRQNKEKC